MPHRRPRHSYGGSIIIGLAGWLIGAPLHGQGLPPAQSMQQSIARSVDESSTGSVQFVSAPDVPPDKSALVLQGRLPFQLGLTVNGYYDDNIFIQPDRLHPAADFVWSVAPFLAWNSAGVTGATNSVQMVYSPTLVFYQDNERLDTLDHSAALIYGYSEGRVDLLISQDFSTYQENDPDVGNLIREDSAVTKVQLNYQLAGKTSLDVTARQIYTRDRPGFRSIDWDVAPYLDYQIAPKTSIGLGTVLGAADLEGPNQTYQQANVRAGYNPDAKLSFSGTAGFEFRETQGHDGAELTPDFALGAAYEPFDGTDLGLNAYRRYEYSGRFFGDDFLSTGVSAFVSQRFLHRLYFILSGSFEDAQYRDNFTTRFAPEDYHYFTVRPAISLSPVTGVDLRVFYQYRLAVATGGIEGFTDDQIGFAATLTY